MGVIMKRTNIYIDDDMIAELKRESKQNNTSISEIIRDSLKNRNKNRKSNILSKLNNVFGLWKNRNINVNDYINNIRKDRKIW